VLRSVAGAAQAGNVLAEHLEHTTLELAQLRDLVIYGTERIHGRLRGLELLRLGVDLGRAGVRERSPRLVAFPHPLGTLAGLLLDLCASASQLIA
jgi:hypothetical protein